MGVKGLNRGQPARLREVAELFLGKDQAAFLGLRDLPGLDAGCQKKKKWERETVGQGRELGKNPMRVSHFPAINPFPGRKALLPPSCVAMDKPLTSLGCKVLIHKVGRITLVPLIGCFQGTLAKHLRHTRCSKNRAPCVMRRMVTFQVASHPQVIQNVIGTTD